MHMRLMLLGGGNALGQALIRLGAEQNVGCHAPRPPEGGWDSSHLTTLLDEHRPDALVNLAYYFDWFQAGQVADSVLQQQEQAVERLAELCQHHGVILLQPSSYRVFDGARTTAYSETDEVAPLDNRSQALWRIEQTVRALCPRHVLLRLGWLLDDSPNGILGRFLQRLERNDPVFLADDRRGNPTPVDDAARVILAILNQLDCLAPLWGTYHYAGHEAATPLVVGQAMYAEAAKHRQLRLQELTPRAHADFPDAATEPQHGVLACRKILNTFGIKPRAWRTGLPNLVERYYRHD
ncbi:sugar nucleotide-binding protein [Stutzerimonas kirkiae]|uniref:dTDP-4-dehydrorhamnose reductase n=1 Tax=Stutzerimonas kirkiae TaxID=2211392 RepID=A0A4Q9R115_9GAMM|nr:sugar nucleotide-binding protein [Stutzerimonas kirkiae]TBU92643.1 dTDP-4-dehydrorhamnose reductase [Stutzerimonas kirkiae]TBV00835.1 dTDP-4-dehydrorhamnose reductase [Stutzerimonas kirkiae]TBV08726.1 dTDP-4-dehydrorhamnose reductase [Stutzerimonas kirkiae]TBV11490.1 dTDP-4-dehydrorhamnose reductase [Stutzerimonas kirkiae]